MRSGEYLRLHYKFTCPVNWLSFRWGSVCHISRALLSYLSIRPSIALSYTNPNLKCLLQARDLTDLKLRVGNATQPPEDDFREGSLNLPLHHGDEFPALSELSLDPVLQTFSLQTTVRCGAPVWAGVIFSHWTSVINALVTCSKKSLTLFDRLSGCRDVAICMRIIFTGGAGLGRIEVYRSAIIDTVTLFGLSYLYLGVITA